MNFVKLVTNPSNFNVCIFCNYEINEISNVNLSEHVLNGRSNHNLRSHTTKTTSQFSHQQQWPASPPPRYEWMIYTILERSNENYLLAEQEKCIFFLNINHSLSSYCDNNRAAESASTSPPDCCVCFKIKKKSVSVIVTTLWPTTSIR